MYDIECLKSGNSEDELSYYERALVDLAPEDAKQLEHAAFEVMMPGDPVVADFIDDMYTKLSESSDMPMDEYITRLAGSIFRHADYLAREFPDRHEHQAMRLQVWLDTIWAFAQRERYGRTKKTASKLNRLARTWTRNYGYRIEEVDV